MGPTPTWDQATKRWYALDIAIRDKAAKPYSAGIKGHEDNLDYCARILEDAMDWAIEDLGGSYNSIDLSRKADEYEETMLAQEIIDGLSR